MIKLATTITALTDTVKNMISLVLVFIQSISPYCRIGLSSYSLLPAFYLNLMTAKILA